MAQINAPYGANRKKTIVGRGASSKGRACGRGHDGQNSRSGGGVRLGFEGGQMPLYRRVASFKVTYVALSLSAIDAAFADGDVVTAAALKEKGLVKGKDVQAKILNNGEITKKLTIEGVKVSASAAKAVEQAGGSVK